MLFWTSLLVLVGAADHAESSPRKLQIINTKAHSQPSNPEFGADSVPLSATIHDLRTSIPLFNIVCEAQSGFSGDGARNGDLHLRHLQHETPARYRDYTKP